MMNNIQTLDWLITTKCNDKCGFCYAPMNFKDDNKTLDYYLKICDCIKNAGFKNVGICGGEPTVFPFLREVIMYLHSIGIDVSLYTNCTNIQCVVDVMDYLYSISIPLDSITYINSLRNKEHFEHVSNMMDLLENNDKFNAIIKIGTVVTKVNVHEIPKIHSFISKYKKISVWKLYQYSPGGRCKANAKYFEIEEEQFYSATYKLELENKKIITRTREQTKGYCVLMSQNGDFYLYNEDYNATNTNIFTNTIEEITQLYNFEENKIQKDWVTL